MDVRIPDVSSYQGIVDWRQVLASGRAGGICKATEGTNFVDGQFIRNWSTLGGLPDAMRGCYHFARVGSSLPAQQADRFVSIVRTVKPGDILVLDLEVGDGNLSSWAGEWLAEVQRLTNLTPWIYSYGPFIRQHLTDPALAQFPLWLAAYQSTPPACPPPWKSYRLWQHTDRAIIPGISGPCDESIGRFDTPTPEVRPMFDPPLQVVDAIACPTGGAWGLGADGGIYGFGGAPMLGNVVGKSYFAGRKPARLWASDDPEMVRQRPGYTPVPGQYVIQATSGEFYGPGF
jgi:lysozyme